MEISLGFLVVLIFVLFPGLLFRRFYYLGPFSREFSTGKGVGGVIAISIIPGLVIAFLSMILYGFFFTELNLDLVIDGFKEINDPQFKRSSSDGTTPFNDLIFTKIFPFLTFEYVSSFLLGLMGGRLVRITRLDTRSALLRFKDCWFYLFSGELYGKQRTEASSTPKGKHLFTKVEILSEFNDQTYLYSGFVVDYELSEHDIGNLSKVILRNAKRYCITDKGMTQSEIDGDLLVVDCSTMKNINLTYYFDKPKVKEGNLIQRFLASRIPDMIDLACAIIALGSIPFFIFRIPSIQWEFYHAYFADPWYTKIVFYFLFFLVWVLLSPFEKVNGKNQFVSGNSLRNIFISLLILFIIWYFLHY